MHANMLTNLKHLLSPPSLGGESTHQPPQQDATAAALERIEQRLKRMESRLCQLMLDQGSDIHVEDHRGA